MKKAHLIGVSFFITFQKSLAFQPKAHFGEIIS